MVRCLMDPVERGGEGRKGGREEGRRDGSAEARKEAPELLTGMDDSSQVSCNVDSQLQRGLNSGLWTAAT